MAHSEIEKVLGFHILNYDNITSDKIVYETMQNEDGSIGRIDL